MKSILSVFGVLALVACGEGVAGLGSEGSDVVSSPDTSLARTIQATEQADLVALGNVWNVRDLDSPGSDVHVRLVETGGGDPAINGNLLYLVVERKGEMIDDPETGKPVPLFQNGGFNGFGPLGNVRSVERAERTAEGTVELTVIQDSFDDNTGDAVQNTVGLSIEIGADTLTLYVDGEENGEESGETILPNGEDDVIDAAAQSVFRVATSRIETADGGELVSRIYSGGTSTSYGFGPLTLNVMQYPTDYTFDLGIEGALGNITEYPAQRKLDLEVEQVTEEGLVTFHYVVELQEINGVLEPYVNITKNDP